MGRIHRLILIDEVIWTQFQALYPRQASKIVEDTFRSLINIKLDITDEEGEFLQQERDKLQLEADDRIAQLKEYDLKIRAWEAKKREEQIKEKRERDEYIKKAAIMAEAMHNAGGAENVKW